MASAARRPEGLVRSNRRRERCTKGARSPLGGSFTWPCSRQTVQVDRESHKRRESDNTGRLPI